MNRSFIVLLFGLLLFYSASTTSDEPNATSTAFRIVGGYSITISAIPFICSIRQRNTGPPVDNGQWSWLCGGTVVNQNWLLTSAHCIFGLDIARILVVCGLRQARTIQLVQTSPAYVQGQKGNDLALVLLKKPLVFSDNVQPITIWDGQPLPSNEATIVGYGLSSYDVAGWRANGLQAATVPILSNEQCYQRLGYLAAYLTTDTICTDNGSDGAGNASGDSGGPVIIATEQQAFNLIAIPSWTVSPCGSGPSMHTLISPHINWILDVITPNLVQN
ncbi:LOW QUALITY PROTEIN: chymotrypsin B-like [Armigeres subalbatus]|uniref:LOW QUALITY PROTEIN: chymotrypsin B-like n=1 Tax=Armigeres subalbatus TaxID=124917 RepID=UPI002ED59294